MPHFATSRYSSHEQSTHRLVQIQNTLVAIGSALLYFFHLKDQQLAVERIYAVHLRVSRGDKPYLITVRLVELHRGRPPNSFDTQLTPLVVRYRAVKNQHCKQPNV